MSDAPADDRLGKLMMMLRTQPQDPFLLYGVAMEHKKRGSMAEALRYLGQVIERDPGYCYAYFQQGQIHENTGNFEAAKQAYRAGIEASVRHGDAHAKTEIEGALSMIE